MKFDNLQSLAFECSYAIEKAAKAAGFDILDTGASAQSCSTYITLQREDEDGENEQTLAIRISDHTARSCISHVDYHVSLGTGDPLADAKLPTQTMWGRDGADGWEECGEFDEGAEANGFLVGEEDFTAIVSGVIAAAEAAEWSEM